MSRPGLVIHELDKEPGHREMVARAIRPLREHRSLRLLWLCEMAVAGARWATLLAMAWLALDLTRSAAVVGIVGAAAFAPMMLGPVAGALADRYHRPRLIAAAQFTGVAAAAALALAILAGVEAWWQMVIVAFVAGVGSEGSQPARVTLAAELAEDDYLDAAVGVVVLANLAGAMVAGTITGVTLTLFGPGMAVLQGAIWYLAAVSLVLQIREPRFVEGVGATLKPREIAGATLAILSAPTLRPLLIVTIICNVLIWPYPMILLPVLVEVVFGTGASGFTWLIVAHGAGTLIGAALASSLGGATSRWRIFVAAAAVFAVGLFVMQVGSSLAIGIVAITVVGIATAVFMVVQRTLVLTLVAREARGRSSGVLQLAIATLPIGIALQGYLVDEIGAQWAIGLACGLFLLALATATALPHGELRRK